MKESAHFANNEFEALYADFFQPIKEKTYYSVKSFSHKYQCSGTRKNSELSWNIKDLKSRLDYFGTF